MEEDALITLFEKANIKIGQLNPNVIKAWFDTDCNNLLQWMCTCITEESYASCQQELEYSECDTLDHNTLQKEVKIIEANYPDIFEVNTNLFDIEFLGNEIEELEEEITECNHQIHINEELYNNLSNELSVVTMRVLQLQLEEESAVEKCVMLSKKFDNIVGQTYDQILKYGSYLSSYEFAQIPAFANKVAILEFEQNFSETVSNLNSLVQVQHDSFEASYPNFVTDTLSEIKNCIFQSKVRLLGHQMEIEALNSTLNILENYRVEHCISHDSLVSSIGISQNQQTWMLNIIEKSLCKLAEYCIKQPKLKCLKSECEFFQLKLNYLNNSKESFLKIICHFMIMHDLYLQEKVDINNSSQFFRNINNYINNDIRDTTFRIEALLHLIAQYEDFSSGCFENKFKLIGNFGAVFQKQNCTSINEIVESVSLLRNNTENLKKQQLCSVPVKEKVLKELCDNTQHLQDFLVCGPTSQVITVPIPLRTLLFKVNQNLINQHSSVKALIQAAQKPKDQMSKDKWIRYHNLLWTYFMTGSVKLLSFIDQLKTSEKPFKEQDI